MITALARIAALVCLGCASPYAWFSYLAFRDGGVPLSLHMLVIAAALGWIIAAALLWDRSFWRRKP